ncbi:hypothetical protein EXIGLDRAFT_693541 [Exidia glandulosa HHB12029]|uniref:Uncharacterized protein n=1 Tax=Exidia glandulosa HHB12029 TaxID=1314781 RepID=A0A165H7X4_EXIGL|nr:hypothetical protein EXIGLDRAFT_693541 [Exidia glandulosa HHB12029]
MYKTNGTREYLAGVKRETRIFLMHQAVRLEKKYSEKHGNAAKVAHDRATLEKVREKQERASERRARRDAGLAGPEETRWCSAEDLPALDAKDKLLTIERLKSELWWHKERGNREAWPKARSLPGWRAHEGKPAGLEPGIAPDLILQWNLSGTKAVLYAWLKEILQFEDAPPAAQDDMERMQDSTEMTLDSLTNEVEDLEDEEQEELYHS